MGLKLLRGVGQARAKFNDGSTDRFIPFAVLKEINLGITVEDARQTGGDRLFPLDIYTHSKSGRVRITDAQLNLEVLEMMGAQAPEASANMLVWELLTVSSGEVTTNADFVSGTIYIQDENGDIISPSVYSESGTDTITGLGSYDGTKIKVYYETADATGITNYALRVNDEQLYFELVHSSRYRDPADNTIKLFQIRIYRCRLLGNLEFTYTHGDFTAPVIEGEVLDPGRSDGKVLEYAFGTQPAGLVQI